MPGFQFKLAERVIVPGTSGVVQGLVVARRELIDGESEYIVRFLRADGQSDFNEYLQSVLIEAQPAAPAVTDAAASKAKSRR